MDNSRPSEPSLLATRRGSRTRKVAVITSDDFVPPPAPQLAEARALKNTAPSLVSSSVSIDNASLSYASVVPMPKFCRGLDSVSEQDGVRNEPRRTSAPSSAAMNDAARTAATLPAMGRRQSAPENHTRVRHVHREAPIPLVLDGMPTAVEPFTRSQNFSNLDLSANSNHDVRSRGLDLSSHSNHSVRRRSSANNSNRIMQTRSSRSEEEELRHVMEISRSEHSVSHRSFQEEDEELMRVMNLSLQETGFTPDESLSDFESVLELSKREFEEQAKREDYLEKKEKRSLELALRLSQRDISS